MPRQQAEPHLSTADLLPLQHTASSITERSKVELCRSVTAVQVRSGLTEAVAREHTVKLNFTDVGKLPPPVLQFIDVTFGYTPDRVLYEHVSLPLIPSPVKLVKITSPALVCMDSACCPLVMQEQVQPGNVATHALSSELCRWIWG